MEEIFNEFSVESLKMELKEIEQFDEGNEELFVSVSKGCGYFLTVICC